MGVREKWSLRYVVGPTSIQNTDEYLCKFSVPRGGVEKTENENVESGGDALKIGRVIDTLLQLLKRQLMKNCGCPQYYSVCNSKQIRLH